MRYEIVLAPEAVQDLDRLGARDRALVLAALERYLRFEPTKVSKSRIKRLRGLSHPQYRLRVEDIRVFYDITEDIHEKVLEVLAIVPKSHAASRLKEWEE